MKRLVVDIETDSKHKHIWLAVTKDIDTNEIKVWKRAEEFQDYIKDASLIIAHNGIGFDFKILNSLWKTRITLRMIFDTLIASRLLDPSRETGHSLEAWGRSLGKKKTDYRRIYWRLKGIRNKKDIPQGSTDEWDNPNIRLLEKYCIRDVTVTTLLYHKLIKELADKQFSQESIDLEHKVAAIISDQERNGFKLDTEYATLLLVDIKGKMAGIYDAMQQRWPPIVTPRFHKKTGKEIKPEVQTFNPGSRQQIAAKLRELGWKPDKFTDKGHTIVDEDVLAKINNIPEAKMIAEYLMLQKRVAQIESWLDAVGSDGRVHGKVITNGAVTGRMTHSSPNMAQIPNAGSVYGHECRECWTVEEGNVLVGCDASGLELRMLAHYMKDQNYIQTVTTGSSKDGTDVHTVNQRSAGLPTRDAAKTFIYAFLYGAGDAKIGSIVGGSSKEGAKLKAKFLKQTPALAKLLNTVSKYAAKGWVPGLDGRRIWVRSEHAALNSLLQGAGAIVMKKGLVMLAGKLQKMKLNAKFVANVHDEWQIECSPEHAETVGKLAVDSIKEAGEYFKLRCPLDGEYKVGRNWKETH